MTRTYGPAMVLAGCSAMLVVFAFSAAPPDTVWVAAIVLASMAAGAALMLAIETAIARQRARRGYGSIGDGTLRRFTNKDPR